MGRVSKLRRGMLYSILCSDQVYRGLCLVIERHLERKGTKDFFSSNCLQRHNTCVQRAEGLSHGRNIKFNLHGPSAQNEESWVVMSVEHISAPYKEELSIIRVI